MRILIDRVREALKRPVYERCVVCRGPIVPGEATRAMRTGLAHGRCVPKASITHFETKGD